MTTLLIDTRVCEWQNEKSVYRSDDEVWWITTCDVGAMWQQRRSQWLQRRVPKHIHTTQAPTHQPNGVAVQVTDVPTHLLIEWSSCRWTVKLSRWQRSEIAKFLVVEVCVIHSARWPWLIASWLHWRWLNLSVNWLFGKLIFHVSESPSRRLGISARCHKAQTATDSKQLVHEYSKFSD